MIGSVFSSYYAWSGRGDPLNHCAMNVALYSRRGNRWAMTERARGAVQSGVTSLAIGPSQMQWEDGALTITVDEVTCPIPSRIRGKVRLYPEAMTVRAFALDEEGAHRWWPIAPQAHIEVHMAAPDLRWSGRGYFDTNHGTKPLEQSFRRWNWSYARVRDKAALFYDTVGLDGAARPISALIDKSGAVSEIEPPPVTRLPRTRWMMAGETRADAGHEPRAIRTLEDTPFYARSVLATRLFGQDCSGMHERLCLERLSNPAVRLMIPFRNPRAWG